MFSAFLGAFSLIFVLFATIWQYLLTLRIPDIPRKSVLVTGCDSGFGREAALKLADIGMVVFAGCLTDEGVAGLRSERSDGDKFLIPLKLDVTKDVQVKNAFDLVNRTLAHRNGLIKLWAVINNAAIEPWEGPYDLYKLEHYQQTLDVNILGAIRIVQQFGPLVEAAKGRLVIVTSIKGRLVFHENGPYAVSKYALEAYADTLRRDLYPFGVSVHVIQPGGFRTKIMAGVAERFKSQWESGSPEIRKKYGPRWFESRYNFWTGVRDPTKGFQESNYSAVVDAYVHSVVGAYPKYHYIVGRDAWVYYFVSLMPPWLQDLILRRIFGQIWEGADGAVR